MKRVNYVLLGVSLGFWCVVGTGCGIEQLKDSNRRLKEANDRLVSENSRLEEENAGLQKRLVDLERAPPSVATLESPNVPTREATKPALDDELLIGPDVEITKTSQGIRFTIPDRVFFALGQASLTKRGATTLDRIASVIHQKYPGKTIRVDGHTDDTPIRKVMNKYPTNWELSTARACTVVRHLVEKGVNPQRIYPAGFSYYRPVSNSRTAGARGQNRRVEITVLDESV